MTPEEKRKRGRGQRKNIAVLGDRARQLDSIRSVSSRPIDWFRIIEQQNNNTNGALSKRRKLWERVNGRERGSKRKAGYPTGH
jgi:hypothetical protein